MSDLSNLLPSTRDLIAKTGALVKQYPDLMVLSIADAIASVQPPPPEEFAATRYPYTYSADYLGQHPGMIPPEVWRRPEHWSAQLARILSRPDAASLRRTWARLTDVSDLAAAQQLADAYLAEHGIGVPDGAREEILSNLTRGDHRP